MQVVFLRFFLLFLFDLNVGRSCECVVSRIEFNLTYFKLSSLILDVVVSLQPILSYTCYAGKTVYFPFGGW